ncbi:hypothetical protein FXB78_05660 [Aggregatibacter actinomycetemcomitans]|nr:hypothetical protein FXN58_02700 [Aggregatibacter actinomycetemcomitans]QEH46665.1 hypothetical protein FXN59_02525 [Aggregatibacter actinomycetemcomitans]QEH48685.1 hypothetical protein FXN57_02720 [Aggregatibacter actinomycetemcomitans]TYA51094.1 hypothetical protein FXB81_05845 [Aggregatibacter actinomycetemcomitans]TYB29218.1 hypothetical protein FXB78_05660 [Aggregatibacter actinomycetemcomitans]
MPLWSWWKNCKQQKGRIQCALKNTAENNRTLWHEERIIDGFRRKVREIKMSAVVFSDVFAMIYPCDMRLFNPSHFVAFTREEKQYEQYQR